MRIRQKTVRRIQLGLALSLLPMCGSIWGCMAAPVAFSAMTFGYGGYSTYQMAYGGEASFEITPSNPSPAALDEIRRSKSIVFPPDINAGRTVDIVRERTDLSVVSSTKTVPWMKEHGIEDFSRLPRNERRDALKRLARAHHADLGLMVEANGSPKASGAVVLYNYTTTSKFTTTLISGKTGNVLWTEEHQLRVTEGPRSPRQSELREVIAKGVADRLMEIRTGHKQTVAEKDSSPFACGGVLNFTCDEEPETDE